MDIKISTATKNDLMDCIRLARIRELKLTQGGYLDQEILEALLKNDLFMVAKMDGKVIGFILGETMTVSPGTMLLFFAVDKNYRGQGVGDSLMNEFEKRCKKLKRQWVIIYAPLFNRKTIKFYKKHNFVFGDKLIEGIKELS